MEISRRQLLLTGAVSVPAIALLQPASANAAPAGPAWSATAGSLREVRYFSADFTVAYQLAFPGSIEITANTGSPRAVEVQADLDARLLTLGDSAAVGTEDRVTLGPEVARDETDDRDVAAYRAPMTSLGKWDSVSAALPIVVRPLYPNDGIDGSEGVGVGLSPEQVGGFTDVWLPEVLATDGLAWGGALSAVWGLVGTGAAPYACPSSVSVESVGPGDIPAGATLTISLDGTQVSSVDADRTGMPPGSIFDDVYSAALVDVDGRRELTITLLDATPSGTRRTIRIVTQEAQDAPAAVKASTVSLALPSGADVWQRQTGRELIRFEGVPSPDIPRVARGNR